MPDIILYTRAGCHLCDVAHVVVNGICAELDLPYETIDIDTRPDLQVFTNDVPVISVDGRVVAKWHVSPGELRDVLRPAGSQRLPEAP